MPASLKGRMWIAYGLMILILLGVYAPTLLTQPGGGLTAYMDDVGEIQVSLNVWGTIHHTGYPLFAILGNTFVSIARSLGVSAAFAPTLHSLLWGILGLSVFYGACLSLTRHPEASAAAALILGLTRSVWIHNVIAEVYSLTFFFGVLLLAVALSTAGSPARRVLLLAFIGGLGVAHHRMVAFAAPGLLIAAIPPLFREFPMSKAIRVLIAAIPIALIGFLPYLYLPARASAGAIWVYGHPVDWSGFWHEFSGAEAAFLLHPPPSLEALVNDTLATFRTLIAEMSAPLVLLGTVGLGLALKKPDQRRAALIALLCTPGYVLFLMIFHRAVMPEAVTTPIALVLALGIAVAGAQIGRRGPILISVVGGILLVLAHGGFVFTLTHDPLGAESINAVSRIPDRQGVLMLPWGPRHTATAFSIYVSKENEQIRLLSHTADLSQIKDRLFTLRDTFYRFPPAWWAQQLGIKTVHLSAPADGVVAVQRDPVLSFDHTLDVPVTETIRLREANACREAETAQITLRWYAQDAPDVDYSVFVHLTATGSDIPILQGDSSAPVYGWSPTSRWQPGEYIQDHYAIPILPAGVVIKLGLYEQLSPGQFQNYPAIQWTVDTLPACHN